MSGTRIRLNASDDDSAASDDRSKPDRGANADPEPMEKVVLAGEDLRNLSASLKPIVGGLKNAAITFCAEGAIVQGSMYGQRLFVPLLAKDFTSYNWRGEPAVFLSATDSRRTLLDAFRQDKKKSPTEVTFAVTGTAPGRSITQTVSYAGDGCPHSTSAMKYELWASCTMYPDVEPDVSFALTKQQMGKVAAVAGRVQHEPLTFAMKPEGGLYVGTVCEVIRFDVDGSNMKDYPYSEAGSSVLRLFIKNGKSRLANGVVYDKTEDDDSPSPKAPSRNKNNQRSVIGTGSGKPFCLALEDSPSFRAMLQKIRTGSDGMDLSFYTSTPVPMLRVRLRTPSSPSVFLFCTSDCVPMHELEAVSAVSGSVGQKQNSGSSKKRTATSALSGKGADGDADYATAPHSEKKLKRSIADKKQPRLTLSSVSKHRLSTASHSKSPSRSQSPIPAH